MTINSAHETFRYASFRFVVARFSFGIFTFLKSYAYYGTLRSIMLILDSLYFATDRELVPMGTWCISQSTWTFLMVFVQLKLEIQMKIRNEYVHSCETVLIQTQKEMHEIETFALSFFCFVMIHSRWTCYMAGPWNGRNGKLRMNKKCIHNVEIELWSTLSIVSWEGKRTIKFEWLDFHIVEHWIEFQLIENISTKNQSTLLLHSRKYGIKCLTFTISVQWIDWSFVTPAVPISSISYTNLQ